MKFSQPLRMDYDDDTASFVTRRVRNSQLVFANNNPLEKRILGALGRYLNKFDTAIYAFCLFGSHDHNVLQFQPGTKSNFFRDFGARTAEAIKKFVPDFGGGSVFERRTSEQAVLPDSNAYLNAVMYTILQPIAAGLCKNLRDYPGFNSFQYMLSGKPLMVEFFKGSEYNKAKHNNKNVDPANFIERYQITFKRIPGYEHLSQKDYRNFLLKEYKIRRDEIIGNFEKQGYKWPDPARLKRTHCNERARNPKKSTRLSFRPLCMGGSKEAQSAFKTKYFDTAEQHRKASERYLAGDIYAKFPPGTNKPPGPFVWN